MGVVQRRDARPVRSRHGLEADSLQVGVHLVGGERFESGAHRPRRYRQIDGVRRAPILRPMRPVLIRSIVALALLVSACGQSVDVAASGQEIYLQICARCHADDLSGGFGPPLVGEESRVLGNPKEFFIQTIGRGLGRMPSFRGTLSDEQIERVADFVVEQQNR